jgi:hypothetical protein
MISIQISQPANQTSDESEQPMDNRPTKNNIKTEELGTDQFAEDGGSNASCTDRCSLY